MTIRAKRADSGVQVSSRAPLVPQRYAWTVQTFVQPSEGVAPVSSDRGEAAAALPGAVGPREARARGLDGAKRRCFSGTRASGLLRTRGVFRTGRRRRIQSRDLPHVAVACRLRTVLREEAVQHSSLTIIRRTTFKVHGCWLTFPQRATTSSIQLGPTIIARLPSLPEAAQRRLRPACLRLDTVDRPVPQPGLTTRARLLLLVQDSQSDESSHVSPRRRPPSGGVRVRLRFQAPTTSHSPHISFRRDRPPLLRDVESPVQPSARKIPHSADLKYSGSRALLSGATLASGWEARRAGCDVVHGRARSAGSSSTTSAIVVLTRTLRAASAASAKTPRPRRPEAHRAARPPPTP